MARHPLGERDDPFVVGALPHPAAKLTRPRSPPLKEVVKPGLRSLGRGKGAVPPRVAALDDHPQRPIPLGHGLGHPEPMVCEAWADLRH